MNDALTYNQRLKLGAIRVRRDLADEARQQAMTASLTNDHRTCEMMHAEADRHEAAIIAATREMNEEAFPPRIRAPRLAPVVAATPETIAARAAWRTAAVGRDGAVPASVPRPIDDWHKFVAKLG